MDKLTFDCRQLEQWDFVKQPPVPLRSGATRQPLAPAEVAALKSAARFGKFLTPILGTMEEVLDIASTPVAVTVLPPAKLLIAAIPTIKFSTSRDFTGSIAIAGSASFGVGFIADMGFFASTTREVGSFVTLGTGLFFNTFGGSLGGEVTLIAGNPTDFSGPYFGVSIGAGTSVGFTETALFIPTPPPPALPTVLTFMGAAFNVSAVTPTKLPVTVALQVTDTKIIAIKKF
jgi:hypothetical protein